MPDNSDNVQLETRHYCTTVTLSHDTNPTSLTVMLFVTLETPEEPDDPIGDEERAKEIAKETLGVMLNNHVHLEIEATEITSPVVAR